MSKIAVIGVGNMGYAYVQALVKREIVSKDDIVLFDVSEDKVQSLITEGFTASSVLNDQLSAADVVVLAVKPQFFADMASKAQGFVKENQVLLSIMAGVKSSVISSLLGTDKIVRAMPNTPCMLNEGITGFYFSATAEMSHSKAVVLEILNSTGKTIRVATEDHIDVVTAISGSGPAYFYYFVQQLAEQGKALGLSLEEAETLANYTMKGAFHMIEQKGDQDLGELIAAVTSKGGTTEAALKSMRDNEVGMSLKKAVSVATNRAKELSDMIENSNL